MRGRETDWELLILAIFVFLLGIASLWGELLPQLSMCSGGLLHLLGLFLALIGAYGMCVEPRAHRRLELALTEQARQLVSKLRRAIDAVCQIDKQVGLRQTGVEQLGERPQAAEVMLNESLEELEAVAVLLTKSVRAESRRAFWIDLGKDMAVAMAFFMLGTVLGK